MAESSKRGTNGKSDAGDNPYLQHLPAHMRGAGKPSPDPLEGLVPRYVTADQARGVLVSGEILFASQLR